MPPFGVIRPRPLHMGLKVFLAGPFRSLAPATGDRLARAHPLLGTRGPILLPLPKYELSPPSCDHNRVPRAALPGHDGPVAKLHPQKWQELSRSCRCGQSDHGMRRRGLEEREREKERGWVMEGDGPQRGPRGPCEAYSSFRGLLSNRRPTTRLFGPGPLFWSRNVSVAIARQPCRTSMTSPTE